MYIAAPYWTEKPVSQNVTANDNVTFHCRGAGIPEPSVQWEINSQRLAGEFHCMLEMSLYWEFLWVPWVPWDGNPMGMGIAKLVSWEWEWKWEWLDGNGRE